MIILNLKVKSGTLLIPNMANPKPAWMPQCVSHYIPARPQHMLKRPTAAPYEGPTCVRAPPASADCHLRKYRRTVAAVIWSRRDLESAGTRMRGGRVFR